MQMDNHLVPAYTPSPGEILKMELDARGWTQGEFAEIIDKPPQAISQIITGKKQITPETALRIAKALGTSPELWNNLEAAYQLELARQHQPSAEMSAIERKSFLHQLAPVRELESRGWLPPTEALGELETAVCDFLGIQSLQEKPRVAALLRQSERLTPEVSAQIAWVSRVEQLVNQAAPLPPITYDQQSLLTQLLALTKQAEDVADVPQVLREHGIHFVIVPPLAKAYIDGATFETSGRRVIALTLRNKRIDSFWFTLLHELAHILLGHGAFRIDLEVEDEVDLDEQEIEANQQAATWLIPPHEFQILLQHSKDKIFRPQAEEFAARIGRHPGIIAGRLKREQIWEWRWHRQLQVDVDGYLRKWVDKTIL